jgi:hypothetical protein
MVDGEMGRGGWKQERMEKGGVEGGMELFADFLVVSMVYTAKTEEEMLKTVQELYNWFTENTVYKELK